MVRLQVPPLRERAEDVPLLAYAFAERFAKEAGKAFHAFSEEVLAALAQHRFPGNVRELRNIIERAVVFSRGPVIGSAELPEEVRALAPRLAQAEASPVAAIREATLLLQDADGAGLEERLEGIERALIEQALERNGGNRSRAAKLLKLKRTTLLQKMLRLDIGARKSKAIRKPKPRTKARVRRRK